MHRGRSMCETCWTPAAPCWTGSAMLLRTVCFSVLALVPGIRSTIWFSSRKMAVFRTKVRHRTPMVRSASVVSLSTSRAPGGTITWARYVLLSPFPPSFYPTIPLSASTLITVCRRLQLSVHSATNQSPFCKQPIICCLTWSHDRGLISAFVFSLCFSAFASDFCIACIPVWSCLFFWLHQACVSATWVQNTIFKILLYSQYF